MDRNKSSPLLSSGAMMNPYQWKSSGATPVSASPRHYGQPVVGGPTHYQHNTGAAPAPSIPDGPSVSADEVGAAFALQYFKIMKTRPGDLFCFYNSNSRVSRGTSTNNATVDVRHATGPARIRDLLYKEHSCGTRLALAIINNLEAQDSAAGAVIVQITGTLKFVDDTSRDFVMSAFLVHQDNGSAFDYYVLNDILLFLQQQPQQSQENNCTFTASRPLPADKQPQQLRISKPGFNLPQPPRLTQEPIDPVHPPIAPAAQPAAAALPTTTAPQLSGATNTPLASSDDLLVSLGSLGFSGKDTDTIMEEQQLSSPDLEETHSDHHQESLSSSEHNEKQHGMSEATEEHGDEKRRMNNQDQQPVVAGGRQDKGIGNNTEQQAAATQNVSTEQSTTTAPKEKKSVWKTPAAPHASPEGFGDIAAPSHDKANRQQQSSAKSMTDVATSLSSASTASKRFQPVDPSHYSESSYAAKLLRPGPNGLRAPCQAGFAVPPAHDKTVQERRDRRSFQSYRNRPGRGKTLWISLLPAELSDVQIRRAVSDQLRGQSCEGHVVRIERLSGQPHGYIELDTEMCAKLLIDKGLHLQGREVTVDFPGRNQRQQRRSFQQQQNDGENVSDEARRQQQGQRRPYNPNNQRYQGNQTNQQTNGYPQHNSNNNTNNNSGSTSSVNSQQENEEGWTPASSRHRKPQQQNKRPNRPQQNYNSNNSNNNSNNNQNRRRNSDANSQNKSYGNNNSRPQQSRPQLGGQNRNPHPEN